MFFKVLLITLAITPLLRSSLALSAFDCRGTSINKTTISLVETPSCIPKNSNITSSIISAVVTQTTSVSSVKFYRCQVEAFHIVQRCGVSIDTWHNGGMYSEVHPITREECKDMVDSGFLNLRWGGEATRLSLPKGGKYSYPYTSYGSISSDGSCTHGGTLVSPDGRKWERALRHTRLEITYTDGIARLFHDEDVLRFPNGVSCPGSAERCEHSGYGHIFWKKPSPDCDSENSKESVVYSGNAALLTDMDHNGDKYIQVNQGHYDFQIKLLKTDVSVCGFKSYSTEHPRLFVTILGQDMPIFPLKRAVDSQDVNLLNYVNSKFIYVLRHTKKEVDKLFDLFYQERCKMQNRITENLMTLALLSPKEFAYQYFKSPGYTAVVRGEVVHVARCREVAIVPMKVSEDCYNELPVVYNNETWFMTPRTRILVRVGTIVECASDLGPQFLLNGRWVTPTSTGLMTVREPIIITPEPLSYEFERLDDLAANGLYTSDTIQKYQNILTSPLEEKIISSRITSAVMGNNGLPPGSSFLNSFTQSDYDLIGGKISSWTQIFTEKTKNIGSYFGFILFAFFIIRLIVSLINSLVNFRFLRQTHGILVAVCCCFFDALTHFIVRGDILAGRANKRKADKKEPKEDIYGEIELI